MKYISLFSGIGGFEYGIQQSKYADKMECIGYSTMEISDTQRYKMCGNAVTTNVVTYIINNFNFLEDDLNET